MSLQKRNLVPEALDVRMIENNLRDGRVSKDTLKSFLSGLPDESANVEKINIDDETLTGNAGYDAEVADDTTDY